MKNNVATGGAGTKVKIWGSRGSLPAPLSPVALEAHIRTLFDEFFERGHSARGDIEAFLAKVPRHAFGGYGGNTPCVEVRAGSGLSGERIIIDGGSGIRQLGYDLMAGPCGAGQGEVHILMTHFHWDHLIGLPFFTPLFIPGNKVHFHAVQPELRDVIRTVFSKPMFPVPLESLPAKIEYHQLEPRKAFELGSFSITPYQLDHPDPCWGFRFERAGRVYSHCVDTECTRVTREQLGADLPLYQNVDLMVFDAQYTLMETIEKVNWGHAAASIGLDLAMREGVRNVLFMHHDPASSNEKIAAADAQARRYYEGQLKNAARAASKIHEVNWGFAHEGLEVDV